ncbi:NIPSNAP family protein [Lentzea sp. NPDC060358]|uniref:NIPSNAP family protein n=1 Tax=Lentzea sp. NPDC060358 TaxID=3347103 RepID=UPI00365E5EDD
MTDFERTSGVFYEIRRYQARPGLRDEWVAYMESVVLPFQESLGMDVTASFVDEEDPDGYVWIRRFTGEANREELYAKVYEHPRWIDEIRVEVARLIDLDRITVTRAIPTSASGLS